MKGRSTVKKPRCNHRESVHHKNRIRIRQCKNQALKKNSGCGGEGGERAWGWGRKEGRGGVRKQKNHTLPKKKKEGKESASKRGGENSEGKKRLKGQHRPTQRICCVGEW